MKSIKAQKKSTEGKKKSEIPIQVQTDHEPRAITMAKALKEEAKTSGTE